MWLDFLYNLICKDEFDGMLICCENNELVAYPVYCNAGARLSLYKRAVISQQIRNFNLDIRGDFNESDLGLLIVRRDGKYTIKTIGKR